MISNRVLTLIMAATSLASLYLLWRAQRPAPVAAPPSTLLPPVGAYPSGSEVLK